jgi:hypothetical protein
LAVRPVIVSGVEGGGVLVPLDELPPDDPLGEVVADELELGLFAEVDELLPKELG